MPKDCVMLPNPQLTTVLCTRAWHGVDNCASMIKALGHVHRCCQVFDCLRRHARWVYIIKQSSAIAGAVNIELQYPGRWSSVDCTCCHTSTALMTALNFGWPAMAKFLLSPELHGQKWVMWDLQSPWWGILSSMINLYAKSEVTIFSLYGIMKSNANCIK